MKTISLSPGASSRERRWQTAARRSTVCFSSHPPYHAKEHSTSPQQNSARDLLCHKGSRLPSCSCLSHRLPGNKSTYPRRGAWSYRAYSTPHPHSAQASRLLKELSLIYHQNWTYRLISSDQTKCHITRQAAPTMPASFLRVAHTTLIFGLYCLPYTLRET